MAIIGCYVNGPGESKAANIGLTGASPNNLLYVNGTPNKKVKGIDGKESTIKVNEFNIKSVWNSSQIKWVRNHHKNYTRKTISPGCRNCHHGMKKHGFNFVPEKWSSEENEWSEHQTRVK